MIISLLKSVLEKKLGQLYPCPFPRFLKVQGCIPNTMYPCPYPYLGIIDQTTNQSDRGPISY